MFQDARHIKVVRLSALHTSRLYPQEIFLALISLRGCNYPRAMVLLEGVCQRKIPITPSRIEPATSALVARCLNQLRQRERHKFNYPTILDYFKMSSNPKSSHDCACTTYVSYSAKTHERPINIERVLL